MPYRLIVSYDPEAIDDFRSLKGKGGPLTKGLFIAESERIAHKILASPFEVPKAFMTPEQLDSLRALLERRSDHTDIFVAPKSEMEQIIGYHLHQGVMLAVRIPANRALVEVASHWPEPFLAVALDGITDAENMGAIIRTAAAFGAQAIIVDDQSCNPYLRRSVRVSMGKIVDIEIARVPDLAGALSQVRSERPCRIIGAALTNESLSLDEVERQGSVILVFGSEGWGLRREVMDACDQLVRIPMNANVDSLNVAIASGIFLHEFSRH
jgi:tRNA G18 (ribose-2'-O)-methylase SpoU